MKRISAVALCLFAGTAVAQERAFSDADDLRATAAEAARITALKNRCPAHIGIDVGFTETLQGTILMDGIRRVGKETFMRIVKAEQAGLRAEVETVGAAVWCRRQKALLEKALSGRVPALRMPPPARFVLRRSEIPSTTGG